MKEEEDKQITGEEAEEERQKLPAPDVGRLEKEISSLRKELDSRKETEDMYLDQLMRLKAEFENYRKRTEKQLSDNFESGMKSLAGDLLVILDNFHRALDAEVLDKNGIDLISKELMNIFRNKGLSRMEADGAKFDHNYHHAVSFIEKDDAEDGTILEVIQDGYFWKEEVLRPAMVIVSKEKEKRLKEEKDKA